MDEALACLRLGPRLFTQRGQRESMEGKKVFVVLRLAPSRANTGLKLFHEMDGCVWNVSLEGAVLDGEELYLYYAVEQNVFCFVRLNMSLRVLTVHLCCCHD